jgi:hypothetical protein
MKTLKDIPMEQDKPYEYDGKGNNNFDKINEDFRVALNWKRAIRQAAIEWVKEFEKVGKGHTNIDGSEGILKIPSDDDVPDCELHLREEGYSDGVPLRAWIKYFFNLTEDDLK